MTNKIFKYLYLVLLLFFIFSLFFKNKLPEKEKLNTNLFNEPTQTNTTRDPFDFKYREKKYNIHPVADYDLWGLVVSVNNINAWYNYYHDENTVNLKDVCVVWGDNIENEVYRDPEISFKSGEWTCYYQWTGRLQKKFYPNQLSNNHLLTANEQIQESIRNVRIGDQIHLKGILVDYAEEGTDWYRKTSISRMDSNQSSRSGGACEVFYIDVIDVVQKNQVFWNQVNIYSKKIFISLFLIQLIIFIFSVSNKKQPRY